MGSRLKLISLTANVELTKEIAKILNVNVLKTTVTHFADGEILFEGNETFRGDNVYIIQSTCNPVNERLMELLLCIDACKRAGAQSITCVIPYFGYSRQDRKAKARQPISAKLVSDLIETAGADRMVCMDLHAPQIQGFFNIPVADVKALPLFAQYFKKLNLDDVVCVSPDHGGAVRTSKLASLLNTPLAIIDKRRPAPNKAEIIGVVGDVKNKNCIILDDMVDTAGTLCLAAQQLKELGAKNVYAAISHGVLSGNALEKIKNSCIKELIITDSIPLSDDKMIDNIKVLSIAKLIASIIDAMEKGESTTEANQKIEFGNY